MIRYKTSLFVTFLLIFISKNYAQKIISDEKWAVLCRNVPDRVYRRLPNECSRFFICVDGYPSILDCPDNLYFDPDEVICGYPGDIKCFKDVEETSEGNFPMTTSKDVERTTRKMSTTTEMPVWTHEMSPEEEESTEKPEYDDDTNDESILDNHSQVECCRFYGTRRVCSEC